MLDAFALFQIPRGPWLDPVKLREEFHRRSATSHPDAGGDADAFAQLNSAYKILHEPAARLRHLLDIEAPELLTPSPPIPPKLADRFMRVAAARQSATTLLAKYRTASSSLARALLASEYAASARALDDALADLASAQAQALAQISKNDAAWRDHLPELAQLQAEVSFFEKWTAQLRASQLELTLAAGSSAP